MHVSCTPPWRAAREVDRRYCPRVATPDPLADEPFTHLSRADGTILIRYRGAPVTILRGQAAERFASRMSGADRPAAQQLMARATGNFKRGNERAGKQAGR